MKSTWILDLLDRELPGITGAYRDRLAEAIALALPGPVIAEAIRSSAECVLRERGTPDPKLAREIGNNAAQSVLHALHPVVDEDEEGAVA